MTIFLLDHMPGCTPLSPCASCEAVNFLRSKLSEGDFATLLSKVRTAVSKAGPYGRANPAPLETSVDIFQVSPRTANCLRSDNILTIGDLVKKSEAEMLRTPNFGRKSLNEINEQLASVGRHLGEVT